ncbi:MAG: hypothetical protein ACQEXQ_22750 [Bacillota bacterium]
MFGFKKEKKYKIPANRIQKLIASNEGCIATVTIIYIRICLKVFNIFPPKTHV